MQVCMEAWAPLSGRALRELGRPEDTDMRPFISKSVQVCANTGLGIWARQHASTTWPAAWDCLNTGCIAAPPTAHQTSDMAGPDRPRILGLCVQPTDASYESQGCG